MIFKKLGTYSNLSLLTISLGQLASKKLLLVTILLLISQLLQINLMIILLILVLTQRSAYLLLRVAVMILSIILVPCTPCFLFQQIQLRLLISFVILKIINPLVQMKYHSRQSNPVYSYQLNKSCVLDKLFICQKRQDNYFFSSQMSFSTIVQRLQYHVTQTDQ